MRVIGGIRFIASGVYYKVDASSFFNHEFRTLGTFYFSYEDSDSPEYISVIAKNDLGKQLSEVIDGSYIEIIGKLRTRPASNEDGKGMLSIAMLEIEQFNVLKSGASKE